MPSSPQRKTERQTVPITRALAHSVYFELKDSSPEAKAALIAAAEKYLGGHDGCLFFGVGEREGKYQRQVNDQTFHVGLTLIFESVEAHDAYQVHPRHLAYIEEQSPNWADVRVFDFAA